jgi:PAS domain S-box-containing protein
VDAREALAQAGLLGGSIVVIALLALLLTGAAVALVLALRQVSLRQRLLRAERDRASATHLYERVLVLARDPFALLDASGRIVDANEAAVATYGYSRDELLDMNVRDLRAPEARASLETDWEAAASPDGTQFETVHVRKDGSTFPVEVSSRSIDIDGMPYLQSFVREISSRRATEVQLRRLSAAYATLAETNKAILRDRDEATLFESICRIAVEVGGYLGAWVGIAEPSAKRIVPVATSGSLDDYVRELRISIDPAEPESRRLPALAFLEGRPCYSDDILNDPAVAPWADSAQSFGIRASVALPLLRVGTPVGVLSLHAGQPHVFDGQMRALLEEIASQVSFALDGFDREAARRRTEEALAVSRAELAAQLDELRRWNEATLGREERNIELKGSVNALLARLGEPPAYPSAEDDLNRTAPDA